MLKILKKILATHKFEYFSVFVYTAVINILMLTPSWYMLEVYDRVLTSKDINTLWGLSLIIIFLYFIYGVLERYRGLILVGVSESIDKEFLSVIQESFFKKKQSNQEVVSISDLNVFKQFLTGQPVLAFLDAPWFLIYVITIYLLHPMLGLLAILSTALLFGLAITNHFLSSSKLENSQNVMNTEKLMIENISLANESILVMGMKVNILRQLNLLRNEFLINLISASYRAISISAVTKFSRILIQSAALGYAAYLAVDNQISAGVIIACSILLGRALSPIEGIINSWKQFAEFRRSSHLLELVLDNSSHESHSILLGRPKGAIELKNVDLKLREDGLFTLNQINLRIDSGEFIAIIGPSGSGKTSLLKLMAGIYQSNNGRVLLDDSDLSFRNKSELGQYVGYLGQTTELLAGKVSTNIARFGDVDSDKVLTASIMADAHSMILSLPEAYETYLGNYGAGVSEGQKRKIGLARAFYNDPALLFLDEPGTGLDELSIANILASLSKLKQKNKTIVLTTHHPQFVDLADKVVVLIEGRIKIFGKKDDVLKRLRSPNEQ